MQFSKCSSISTVSGEISPHTSCTAFCISGDLFCQEVYLLLAQKIVVHWDILYFTTNYSPQTFSLFCMSVKMMCRNLEWYIAANWKRKKNALGNLHQETGQVSWRKDSVTGKEAALATMVERSILSDLLEVFPLWACGSAESAGEGWVVLLGACEASPWLCRSQAVG